MMHRRTLLASALTMAATASLSKTAFAAQPAPFKLYDTHCYFYTGDVAKYPPRPDVAEAVKTRTMARPTVPEYNFGLWDANGVEMGCGVQYNALYFADNRYLLDVAKQHPQRIVPVVILVPEDSATPATLARMAKENRIAGVRTFQLPDAEGNMPLTADASKGTWEAANALGLTIVLFLNPAKEPQALPAALTKIAALAARYPNANICIDHLTLSAATKFGSDFGLGLQHRALAQHKNIYFKYTTFVTEALHAANVPAKDFFEHAVGLYGADHLVWGSDQGNTVGDYSDFVKTALDAAAGLPVAQQKAIFYNTAKRIFVPGGRGRG